MNCAWTAVASRCASASRWVFTSSPPPPRSPARRRRWPANWSTWPGAMRRPCRRWPPWCAAKAGASIPVQLAAMLTEVGTLEVHCLAVEDPAQRWKLEFQLRGEPAADDTPGLPPRFHEAVACIERVFGARIRDTDPKAVKAPAPATRGPARQPRALADRTAAPPVRRAVAAPAWPTTLGRPRARLAQPGRLVPAAGLRRRAGRLAHRTAVADLRAGRAAWPRRAGQQRMVDAVAPRRRRAGRGGAIAAAAGLRLQPARQGGWPRRTPCAPGQGWLGRDAASGRVAGAHPGRTQGRDRRLAAAAPASGRGARRRRRATPGRCGP